MRFLPGITECDDALREAGGFQRLERAGVLERVSARGVTPERVAEVVDEAALRKLAKSKDPKVREAAEKQLAALTSKPEAKSEEPKE